MNTEPEGKLLGDNNNEISDLSNDSNNLNNSTNNNFFLPQRVSVRLEAPIKYRFMVLLERIGRSQNWLANECDISKGTMSKIVNGIWFPSTTLMERICEILEVQSHIVFGDSEHWKHWHNSIVYSNKCSGYKK